MSRLYGPIHRSLQERFDTRRLADNVEKRVVLMEISPEHKAFIESREMFFLSTIDHQGRPTVSYKGGDPGFVRVLDSKTIAFPCYDGNGMFYSMAFSQLAAVRAPLQKDTNFRIRAAFRARDTLCAMEAR